MAVVSGSSVAYTVGSKIGTDTFSYSISDGKGDAASVTIKKR